MANPNTYSHSGFKYGIIGLLLILNLFIFTHLFTLLSIKGFDVSITDSIIGLIVIGAGIIGIIGFIKSIRGIKEPNSLNKILGFIINILITGLFVVIIISNTIDIYKALY